MWKTVKLGDVCELIGEAHQKKNAFTMEARYFGLTVQHA